MDKTPAKKPPHPTPVPAPSHPPSHPTPVPAPSHLPKKRALLIGINYVGQAAELAGCVNDIVDMRAVCAQLRYDSVCILHDGAWPGLANPADTRIGDGAPTRANILAGFRWLVAGAGRGDHLLLHYSGHGGQLRERVRGSEASGMDDTLVPADYEAAGMIRDDDIRAALVEPLRRTGAALRAVLDCCHSGTGMDLRYNLSAPRELKGYAEWTGGEAPTQLRGAAIAARAATAAAPDVPDVIAVSGCADAQTSADASFGGRPGGALTHYLLEALRAPAAGAAPWPTAVNLLRDLRRGARADGFDQVPQVSTDAPVTAATCFNLA